MHIALLARSRDMLGFPKSGHKYEQARRQEIQPHVASEKPMRSQCTQQSRKNVTIVEEWDTWNTSAGQRRQLPQGKIALSVIIVKEWAYCS